MGKVKSVTNENVVEYVAGRKALGSEIETPALPPVEAPPPENLDDHPASLEQPQVAATEEAGKTQEKPKPKNSVQERIDELTRQRKELEEFSQTEYEARLQAQRRISELESQIKSIQSPQPKAVEEPEPDPEKFTDQKEFLKAWGDWNRKKAISEFQAEEQKRRQEEDVKRILAEANARRQKSLESAREMFPDFDEAVRNADRSYEMGKIPAPSPMLTGLLSESDYQAHILHYLIANPDEVGKLNAMRPGQAAIAIGRLENQFAKPGVKDGGNGKPVTPTTESSPKPRLPEPMTALGTGGGNVTFDPASPMTFTDYKRRRLDEIRMKRARK